MEVTKTVLELMGKSATSIEYIKDRPGHDRRYAVNSTKLRSLGWSPEYSFESAIKETIEWYQANQNWWRPLKSGEYLEYYQTQYAK